MVVDEILEIVVVDHEEVGVFDHGLPDESSPPVPGGQQCLELGVDLLGEVDHAIDVGEQLGGLLLGDDAGSLQFVPHSLGDPEQILAVVLLSLDQFLESKVCSWTWQPVCASC